MNDEPEVGWVRLAQILLAQETGIDVASEAIEIDIDGAILIDTGVGRVSVWPGIGGGWSGYASGRRYLSVWAKTRGAALVLACAAHNRAVSEEA